MKRNPPVSPRWLLSLGGGLILLMGSGCAATEPRTSGPPLKSGEIDPGRVETHDDINQVIQFWNPEPWLYDADRKPVGFRATVYFVSGETGHGAFVPGNIHIWMYMIEATTEGVPKRVPVFEWVLPESESTLYRVRRKSIQGYYYGLQLMWPPEVNIVRRQVEFVIGYERLDGRVLTAPGRRFDVDPAGYSLPTTRPVRDRQTPAREARPSESRDAAPLLRPTAQPRPTSGPSR